MFPEIRNDLFKDIQMYLKVNIGTITLIDHVMPFLSTCCSLCFPASVYKLISHLPAQLFSTSHQHPQYVIYTVLWKLCLYIQAVVRCGVFYFPAPSSIQLKNH